MFQQFFLELGKYNMLCYKAKFLLVYAFGRDRERMTLGWILTYVSPTFLLNGKPLRHTHAGTQGGKIEIVRTCTHNSSIQSPALRTIIPSVLVRSQSNKGMG